MNWTSRWSLLRMGSPTVIVTSAVAPLAAAACSASRRTAACRWVRSASYMVRITPCSRADAGMMLAAVPASTRPTVTTAGWIGSIVLLPTSSWSPLMMAARAATGSIVTCGYAPWPGWPWTTTSNSSAEALTAPTPVLTTPADTRGWTCPPITATTSRSVSRPEVTTVSARTAGPPRVAGTARPSRPATPRGGRPAAVPAPAMCTSWPQACIAPSVAAHSTPVCSSSGRGRRAHLRMTTAGPGGPTRTREPVSATQLRCSVGRA